MSDNNELMVLPMENKTKKNICWEHYKMPFQESIDEDATDFEDEETSYSDGYEDMEVSKKVNYVMTPDGKVFPANLFIPADKSFKFWIGHANFDIDDNVANLIDKAPGVEALKVITRYRFLIGVGKNPSFQDSHVCKSIEDLICKDEI